MRGRRFHRRGPASLLDLRRREWHRHVRARLGRTHRIAALLPAPCAPRRKHVPDAVSDDHRGFDRPTEPLGRGQKQIRVRLRAAYIVSSDDRRARAIQPQLVHIVLSGRQPSARGDGPWDSDPREMFRELNRPPINQKGAHHPGVAATRARLRSIGSLLRAGHVRVPIGEAPLGIRLPRPNVHLVERR